MTDVIKLHDEIRSRLERATWPPCIGEDQHDTFAAKEITDTVISAVIDVLHPPLTEGDIITLYQVHHAIMGSMRARWLTANNDLIDGVVRHFTRDESGAFLSPSIDVRDGYLRISGTVEWFIPVREVMRKIREGEMGFEGK